MAYTAIHFTVFFFFKAQYNLLQILLQRNTLDSLVMIKTGRAGRKSHRSIFSPFFKKNDWEMNAGKELGG